MTPNIPKLIDNKRKHMEKRLSQALRDQVLMNTAKVDILIKKNMMEKFETALEDSIHKMKTYLAALGDGMAAAMQMLAMVLSQNQPTTLLLTLLDLYTHTQYNKPNLIFILAIMEAMHHRITVCWY